MVQQKQVELLQQEAVKKIHPDWDERIEDEVNLIRYEQGMSLDTPD